MSESGTASADAIGRAWAVMFKAQLDAQLATGKITREEYDELVKQTDAAFGKMGQSGRNYSRTLGQELEQMTHRAFDNISRSIARNIVEWKGWADSVKSITKSIAEDILNVLVHGALKKLEDKLAKVLGGIGGGGGGAGQLSGGAGAAGGAGGAASTAGGLAGTVNMVSGVVSAVSSVVGNFQMYGMNKSLDVLVNHTLRTFNELAQFRADAWTREGHWYARTSDMWQTLLDIKDALGRGITANGKGGVNFNNCTFTGVTPQGMMQAAFDAAVNAGAL